MGESTGMERLHLQHESALTRIMGVHWDVWECTGMHERALW